MRNDAAVPATFVDRHEALEARKAIHGDRTLRGLSETFKVLGDPTRLKICLALSHHELCVSDLAAVAGMSEVGRRADLTSPQRKLS